VPFLGVKWYQMTARSAGLPVAFVRWNHEKSRDETRQEIRFKIKSQLLYQLSYRGNQHCDVPRRISTETFYSSLTKRQALSGGWKLKDYQINCTNKKLVPIPLLI
jgi:nicotinamidase-related amidase